MAVNRDFKRRVNTRGDGMFSLWLELVRVFSQDEDSVGA